MFSSNTTQVAAAGGVEDPNFNSVTMLLSGDGTNGAQNNTFLDGSTNNFTITRNGNTTQGTFTPYSPANSSWSNYFDTSYPYVSFPSIAGYDFGTGDFTVEFWFNVPSGLAANARFMSNAAYNASGIDISWESGSSRISWYISGTNYSTATLPSTDVWHHLAYTRSGTTLRVFLDGALSNTYTGVSSSLSGGTLYLSGYGGAANPLEKGYMSNVRFVKGTALYTSAFTPSTTPLTAVSGTSLLTCQSNRFKDNSTNNATATVNGTVKVQRFSPFNPTAPYSTSVVGGSGYFDGTTDYLTVSKNSALEPATNGSWCLETWVYVTSNTSGVLQVVAYANASVASGPDLGYFITHYPGNYINGGFYSGGSQYAVTSAASYAIINEWQHVALTSDGTTMRLFVNGVSVGTPVTVTGVSINAPSSALFKVGQYSNSQYLYGYTTDTRFVKGSAVYTTTFTPPTAPLTAITNTSLLLNYTNGGIYDSAMMNDLETVGNAQISTSVKKYGTGSMSFDGSGDNLKLLSTPNLLFNTGDFTVEFWVYFNSVASSVVIVGDVNSSNGNSAWTVLWNQSLARLKFIVGADNDILAASWSPSTSTWYHVAITRSGTSVRGFVNGTQIGTTQTSSANIAASTSYFYVGSSNDGSLYLNGYVDDLRVTKGYARYTANFTAPTAALPNY